MLKLWIFQEFFRLHAHVQGLERVGLPLRVVNQFELHANTGNTVLVTE